MKNANIGVIQCRDSARFAFKAFRELFLRHFDGDDAVQPRVARPVHLAHAACADGRDDLIGAEFVAAESGMMIRQVYRGESQDGAKPWITAYSDTAGRAGLPAE